MKIRQKMTIEYEIVAPSVVLGEPRVVVSVVLPLPKPGTDAKLAERESILSAISVLQQWIFPNTWGMP